jgi:hypothetical protein
MDILKLISLIIGKILIIELLKWFLPKFLIIKSYIIEDNNPADIIKSAIDLNIKPKIVYIWPALGGIIQQFNVLCPVMPSLSLTTSL